MGGAPLSTARIFLRDGRGPLLAGVLMLPVLVLLLMLLLAPIPRRELAEVVGLRLAGAETTAVVTGRTADLVRGHSGLDGVYTVQFRFDLPGGGTVETSERFVSPGFWRAAEVGARMPVRYVRPWPALAEVEPGATWAYLRPFLILVACLAVPGVLVGWGFWARARGMRAMRLTGAKRSAVVTMHNQQPAGLRNWRGHLVFFYKASWSDEAGGFGATLPHWQQDLPAVGAHITVYADPEGRRPAVWEGDVCAVSGHRDQSV